jgi:hypothetical protein
MNSNTVKSVKRKRTDTNDTYSTNIIANFIYNIDIIQTIETECIFMKTYEKFINTNSLNSKFNELLKQVVTNKLYDQTINILNYFSDDSNSESTIVNQINDNKKYPIIGDKVKVSYYPDSQKYIKYYNKQTFEGLVFFVDDKNDNFYLVSSNVGKIFNFEIDIIYNIQSFKREGCHYFGMSDGYTGNYDYV